MSTIPQQEKDATISFRCPPDWKREIAKAAIDRGQTMQELCIRAISKYSGVRTPSRKRTAEAA